MVLSVGCVDDGGVDGLLALWLAMLLFLCTCPVVGDALVLVWWVVLLMPCLALCLS